ncbi:MAG: restriction endonuclease subunit S [Methanosarcina barkeri]|nr:restriction endonuclease subunit S [Methanosarcina sp. ERenArc_MAG2]
MENKNVKVPNGYKKMELGVIPEEWEVVKVNDFCDVKTGGTPSTKNKDFWDGDIPWMSSGEINKKFVYNTEKKITQKGLENSNARILPADSVMMALNGQGKTRGSVAVLKIPSTCNQSLACMIPNPKINHYLYLFYNLQSRYSEIRNYTGDTGREGLNIKIIKDMNVPLPPLPEQQKIASILSKVDEQIEQTEKIIGKTELLKKV